jgi:hypothetical protein
MAEIIFSGNLSRKDTCVVSDLSRSILSEAGDESKNPTIRITSTLRPPHRQAEAMYNNLSSGSIIRYKAPGQAVCNLYTQLAAEGKPREEIISAMTAKIIELAEEGNRVSLHCVSEEMYAKCNVIDVSTGTTPNPRDLAVALSKYKKVERIITPYDSPKYDSPKISVDKNEPAIHVEISQW